MEGEEYRMSVAENALPVLNRTAAIDAMGGDEEMFNTFLDLFMEDATKQIAGIEAAIDRADAVRLERAAHSLKGAAGTMHAERLSAVARQLETMGKSGDLVGCRAVFLHLRAELENLRRFVQNQ